MFTVINDCNALGEFAQWAQNVIDEESDKSDLLSKLIGDDGTFASSIKMTVGEANIHSLDIEYIDGLDGTTNISNIDALFDNFSPKFIKAHDYMYFYDGLGRWGARGRLTKGQLKELHYNISVMENIILEYGSMDRFVEAYPIHELIDKLSNPKSEYKIKMMGEALACEYLRNVGVDCFKPDVHLKKMLGKERLCVINKMEPDFSDLYFAMTKLKEETGLWMAQIDYILWAYCASGFGEVCTASPNCKGCVVKDYCGYIKYYNR